MYYTFPNDFLEKASVADWKEHEKNNNDRLIALDAQIAVQEKLTPIADDEEGDDDVDEEEEKVATDAEMVDEPPAEMSVDAASPSGATSAKGDPKRPHLQVLCDWTEEGARLWRGPRRTCLPRLQ